MAELKEVWSGWKTVRVIGQGSFGSVYEIRRDIFGHEEKAAVKVISIPQNSSDISSMKSDGYDDASITSRYENYLQDIVREYSSMAEMKGCVNIVYCDDVKYTPHEDGFGWDIFIKMELLTALPEKLPKTITEDQVISIGADICNALAACEERGLLHRDIKPQNIFVSADGTYKLGDFGIAKTVEQTAGGTKTGTYKYMAPEIYNNQPYGLKADQYSLGLVLYWLLNERRMPFLPLPPRTPTAREEESAKSRRFDGEPIPAPAHGSEALKAIVLKACAFDPEQRYASAAEMLADLQKLSATAVLVGTDGGASTEEEIPADVTQEEEDEGTTGASFSTTAERSGGDSDPKAQTDGQPVSESDMTVGGFGRKVQEEKKAPKKKKTWLFAVLAAAAVLLAGLAFGMITGKIDRIMAERQAESERYEQALASYERYLDRSGDTSEEAYRQAALYAANAGDSDKVSKYARLLPKNSSEAKELLQKAAIITAKKRMDNKDWEGAVSSLSQVNTSEAKVLLNECKYHLAKEASASGDYAKAIPLLSGNTYKGASDLLDDCVYKRVQQLMKSESWSEAAALVKKYPSSRAENLLAESGSSYVDGLMKEGQWLAAIDFLNSYPTSGSAALLDECRSNHAADLMAAGRWYDAVSFLDQNPCSNSSSLLSECHYRIGSELMKQEKWSNAIDHFSLSSYSNSSELLAQCQYNLSPDKAFLADMAAFCTGMKNADENYDKVKALVATIEPYAGKTFSDTSLQKAAQAFIKDMQKYRDVLGSYTHRYQIQQQKCFIYSDAVQQIAAINKISAFSSSDWNIITSYWRSTSHWNTLLSLVNQLAQDMTDKSKSGYNSPKQQFVRVPNGSQKQMDVTFWFTAYDSSDKLYSTDEVHSILKKNTKTYVYFEFDINKCTGWRWDFVINSYK